MERDSRFEKGSILYFSPFIFDNGNAPKNKYFLVLQCTEQNVILASLPTSQDHVPTMLEKTHGCINQSDINFNCYLFEKGRVVCTNGFSFPKETYVYGFRLQLFDLYVFAVQENNDETKIEVKGCLSEEEYNAVILCLKNSSSVKRKFKAML
ncbi:MAG: hypothetical protein J6Y55_04635 [Bacteroidales bacterium]|nr:hypothetical protein [Bacteroidales bacterium]